VLTNNYQSLLMKVSLFWVVFVAAMVLFMAPAKAESASEGEEAVQETSVPKNFKYTAVECDNLTVLVRRSIQIFDAEDDSVKLSRPAIIYAETNIVQKLGSYQLDIGDKVKVPSALIKDYVESSQDLTDSQIDAWGVYAANVDWKNSTKAIMPTNVEVNEKNEIVPKEDVVIDLSDETPGDSPEDLSENDDETSPVWWLAGAGAVGLLWYVLWRRPEEESTSKSSKK
jgi:hypothetical protein